MRKAIRVYNLCSSNHRSLRLNLVSQLHNLSNLNSRTHSLPRISLYRKVNIPNSSSNRLDNQYNRKANSHNSLHSNHSTARLHKANTFNNQRSIRRHRTNGNPRPPSIKVSTNSSRTLKRRMGCSNPPNSPHGSPDINHKPLYQDSSILKPQIRAYKPQNL